MLGWTKMTKLIFFQHSNSKKVETSPIFKKNIEKKAQGFKIYLDHKSKFFLRKKYITFLVTYGAVVTVVPHNTLHKRLYYYKCTKIKGHRRN